MVNGLVLATIAVAVLVAWLMRARIARTVRDPSVRVLHVTRVITPAAGLVCGVCCFILIWAGVAAPGVSWLYALLGIVILPFNLLLFVRGKWPR